MFLAVLEDKDTVFSQKPALEDQSRDCWEFFQGVRWVGKDKIELLLTGFYEAEDIATDRQNVRCRTESLQAVLDKAVVVAVEFDTDDLTASAREQFKGNTASARKEVEGACTVEVDIVGKHIKDILLGKISCGPCLEVSGNIEMTSFIDTCNDSHLPFVKSVMRS